MTKPITRKEKRLRAFDKAVQKRRDRLENWLVTRDQEEIDLLASLCASYEMVHQHGQLIAVKPQPVVVSLNS